MSAFHELKSTSSSPSVWRKALKGFIDLECATSTANDDPHGYNLHDDHHDGSQMEDDNVNGYDDPFIVADDDSDSDEVHGATVITGSLAWRRIQELSRSEQMAKENRRLALTVKRTPLAECICPGTPANDDPLKAIRKHMVINGAKLDKLIDTLFGRSAPYSQKAVSRITKRLSSSSLFMITEPFTTQGFATVRCRHLAIVRAANVLFDEFGALRTKPIHGEPDVHLLQPRIAINDNHDSPDQEISVQVLMLFKRCAFKLISFCVLVLNQFANGPWHFAHIQRSGQSRTSLAYVAGCQLLSLLQDKSLWTFVCSSTNDSKGESVVLDIARTILKVGALLRMMKVVSQASRDGLKPCEVRQTLAAFPTQLYARPSIFQQCFAPTPYMNDALLLFARTAFTPSLDNGRLLDAGPCSSPPTFADTTEEVPY